MSDLPVKRTLTHTQKIDTATLTALGLKPEECLEHLQRIYGEECPQMVSVKAYLRRKSVQPYIQAIRDDLNKNLWKIPIANKAVQVRVLDDILNTQRDMSGEMREGEKETLAAQLLNDARATVKQIAEISGTLGKEQQIVQDSRSQTNIITTFVGDADVERKKAILSGLNALVAGELTKRGIGEDAGGDVAGGVAAIPAGNIPSEVSVSP